MLAKNGYYSPYLKSALKSFKHKKTRPLFSDRVFRFGRDGVIRTLDPLHPMQVRYQAALRPDCVPLGNGVHLTATL